MKEGHIAKENSIPFTGYLIEKTLDYIYIYNTCISPYPVYSDSC